MKALVKSENDLHLMDIPIPTPQRGEVLIKVEYAGLCHSDLYIIHGKTGLRTKFPVTLGHEFSGVVVDGDSPWLDQRVCAETTITACGSCIYCRTDRRNLCAQRDIIGYVYPGCFAEYIIVPTGNLHEIPSNLTFQEATLWEPLACVVHGFEIAPHFDSDDDALVVGAGPVGLLTLQVAHQTGMTVSLIDTHGERLDVAKQLGAHRTYLSDQLDAMKECYDVFIECSGNEKAIASGMRLLRRGGVYLEIGLSDVPVTLDWRQVVYKGLKIYGSISSLKRSWEVAGGYLASKKVVAMPLAVYPLDDWEAALHAYESRGAIKVLLKP